MKQNDIVTWKVEMDTITMVLQNLNLTGRGTEFFIHQDGVLDLKGKSYYQRDVKIIKTYRFEGESDPADAAIIYIVRTNDGVTGYCIDAYGIYSAHTNDLFTNFLRDAEVLHSPESSIETVTDADAVLV